MAAPMARPARPAGVTLAEMMLTVALVALAASIAIPDAAPVSAFAADAVAGEVARAVRFAQRDAIRTGAWHVVRFDVAAQSLRVYRLTPGGMEDPGKPVVHPVDKARYEVRFGDMAGARGRLASVEFKYKGRPVASHISFNPEGAPADINPADLRVELLELNGKIVIVHGRVQREVAVARVTGRVTS
jgi:prepilin-type N-terminal cleavage/methylation domain-containing protein